MSSIRKQLTVWIMAVVILVVAVMGYFIFYDVRQTTQEMEKISTKILNQSLKEQAQYRIQSIATSLRHNLVNPVYGVDMLQIKQLINTTLNQADILTVNVYDSQKKLLHDGSELNLSYGLKKIVTSSQENDVAMVLKDWGEVMSADMPIWLFDEYLGSLVIHINLSEFKIKQNLLHQAMLLKSQEVTNKNLQTLIPTLLIFIVLVIVLAIYLGKKLSTPIIELAKHAKRMGAEHHYPALQVSRYDEIGMLQNAFNRMGSDLKNTTVSRDYLSNMMDSLNESLLILDKHLTIQMSNLAANQLFDCTKVELQKHSMLDFIANSDHEVVLHWLSKIDSEECKPIEVHSLSLRGQKCMVSISASLLHDENSDQRIICLFQDITARKLNENKILFLAQYDSLTHLPNRTLFLERLKHAILQADRTETLVALFFIDIDHFKKVNDSLGHAAGDELLIQIALRLKQCVRESDTVSRLGGDEFTVVLELIKGVEEAEKIANKIVNQLSQVFDISGQEVHSSLSLGIAYYPFGDITAEALLKKADNAMYQAKQHGRNLAISYNCKSIDYKKDQLDLENDLRKAVKQEQLELYYQPKMNINSEKITGVEALLRWFHPQKGLIPCYILIPMLEELGLMEKVSIWVLNEACQQAAIWQKDYDISVAVNYTAEQFCHPYFISHIESALKKTGLNSNNLMIEITESSLISNIEISNQYIKRLTKIGVSLAIDDFGTGYSSLAYLRTFSLQWLKIDKAFIESLPSDSNSLAICEAIVAMANALNFSIVAEGVETKQQYQIMKSLGVDEIQGFYFAKPMPKEDLVVELSKNKMINANL